MSSSNKKAKEILIEAYGPECFINKLHLRQHPACSGIVKKTTKAQKERMKQLTYHHILERCKGGRATKENGALLCNGDHQWFNKQSKEDQQYMNNKFQEYKRCMDECRIRFVDDLKMEFDILPVTIEVDDHGKVKVDKLERTRTYNRAKIKEETRKLIEEDIEDERI